jgi:hypothetical protein
VEITEFVFCAAQSAKLFHSCDWSKFACDVLSSHTLPARTVLLHKAVAGQLASGANRLASERLVACLAVPRV